MHEKRRVIASSTDGEERSVSKLRGEFSSRLGWLFWFCLLGGAEGVNGLEETEERPRVGELELTPMELRTASGTKIVADSGVLFVPENRESEDSNLIELRVVRLKSTSDRPGSPLIYLHGGPGGSATGAIRSPQALEIWGRFLERRDVVLLDQRGAGQSRPSLSVGFRGRVPRDLFASREGMGSFMTEVSRYAAARLRENGVDLRGYTTEQSADDLDDLRRALGEETISLLGFSYGTHLGLCALRRHGDKIDRAVLIGVEGPDHTRKLPSTFDTQIGKLAAMFESWGGTDEVGGMEALFRRVLEKLEVKPMEVTIRDPSSGRPLVLPVGAFGLRFLMMIDMGDRTDLPVFPRLLAEIDRGDSSVLSWFVQKRYLQLSQVSGLLFVMDAASGVSKTRRRRIEFEKTNTLFGDAANFDFPEVAKVWNAPDLGPEFRSPLVCSVPTLFVSGTLDCNTPPFQAEEVRWGFSRAEHLILDGGGHETWMTVPEVLEAIYDHMAERAIKTHLITLPPLQFVPLEDGGRGEGTHPSVARN